MANGLPARAYKFAWGIDVAINGACGGRAGETCSGSIGRARWAERKWAPTAEAIVDGIFGKGHCQNQAIREEAIRVALAAAGLD